MKSRISFFNATVFRKDITRFFPAWLLYGIVVMIVLSTFPPASASEYRAFPVITHIIPFSMMNLIYAPIVASLLFGDLFKRRLCNGIHALPLRRETLFCTHFVSGLLFSLIPNCIYFLFALINLGSYWYIALYWLLTVTMSYLCFFGIAVFSANCTGNRFAMFCVYAGIVFLPMILYYIYYTLFQPLLYGIAVEASGFTKFSPVYLSEIAFGDLLAVDSLQGAAATYSPSWPWYIGFLTVGLALGGAGLVLYRKRQSETAGDFLSHKIFQPLVLVLCPICMALLLLDFFGVDGLTLRLVLLLPALLLGVILTQMLLRRSTRVFIKSTWVTYALLAGGLGIALLLTALDPIGITRWVPEAKKVESVTVSENGNIESEYCELIRCTEAEDIQNILSLHKGILGEKDAIQHALSASDPYYDVLGRYPDAVQICLDYTLKDGSKAHREYWLPVDSAIGQAYGEILSSPEYVLSTLGYRDWDSFCRSIFKISVHGYIVSEADMPALLEMLKADFDAGCMNQNGRYHGELYPEADLYIYSDSDTDLSLSLWAEESQTYQWLVEHGYLTPDAE